MNEALKRLFANPVEGNINRGTDGKAAWIASDLIQRFYPEFIPRLIQADSVIREDRVRDELMDRVEADPERIPSERHRRILQKWLKLHRSETLTQGQLVLERRHALQRRPGVL